MFTQDFFPRSNLLRSSRPGHGSQRKYHIAAVAFAMSVFFSCHPVAVAADVDGQAKASAGSMRGPDPIVRARLLVAKGAVAGGVFGIAVQLGLAIGLAPASAGQPGGATRQPERSPRSSSRRSTPSPPTPEVPVQPSRTAPPAGSDYSEPPRRRRRNRQPGTRQMIMPKVGTPINISINTYPYYPASPQPMSWQMPAEGSRAGMPIPPAAALSVAEPTVHAASPTSIFPSTDPRPAFAGPQPRGHAAVSRDTNSAVWEQGFERVHRPTPPRPIADDSTTVGSIEGMMKTIIAENLSLRG